MVWFILVKRYIPTYKEKRYYGLSLNDDKTRPTAKQNFSSSFLVDSFNLRDQFTVQDSLDVRKRRARSSMGS